MASPDFIPLPRTTGAPSTMTFTGLGGGMNVAEPSYMIGDDQARYMQDILLDQPGYLRSRGPIINSEGFYQFVARCAGMAITYDPAGTLKLLGYLTGNYYFTTYPFTTVAGNNSTPPAFGNYPAFDSKASLLAGAWIGISTSQNGTPDYWRGGVTNQYATGTVSVARGSTAVKGVGTWWGGGIVSPGMFLF